MTQRVSKSLSGLELAEVVENDDSKLINKVDMTPLKLKKLNVSDDYHTFKIRNSFLDILIDKANINQSEFKGFYNLFMTLLIFYVFTHPLNNYFSYGYFFRTKVFFKTLNHITLLISIWPLFHLWTYLAYVLQILILKGYNKWFCFVFQNLTQAGIFIITTYICLYSDMCTSHVSFILIQCIIHFFKMHSYTQTNRDYREDYLKKLKTKEKPISSYPDNINFGNFLYFLRVPTFVYEESYPQNEKFRPQYFILKSCKAIFHIVLLYYIYTEHIEVTINSIMTSTLLELVIKLYFPVCLFTLFMFYLIFECILPAYAELTNFADRQFYDDWWNSTDLEEFNRRWNKIVHEFLYRHVYLECHKRYRLTPNVAKTITFLVSALFHEYCLCIIIKLFRPIMFLLMMMQVPLAIFGRKYLKNTTFGNYFFWGSVLVGECLIFILYNREFIHVYGHDNN
jgi:hypothetical protein